METTLVQLEHHGQTAVVTLNRPNQLNALSVALLQELRQVFAELNLQDVRSVVITGSGAKAFAAGADIAEMKDLDPRGAREYSELGNAVFRQIEQFPLPVIAAVNGYALGGGFELALACDIILAAENAAFSFPEASLGITPGFGGTQRLPRLIGPGKAKDLLYTSRRVKAEEALQLGIVVKIIEKADFREQVLAYAGSINLNAPIAVAAVKRAVNRGSMCDLDTGLAIEAAAFASCFDSNDQKAAMSAFVAKQKPEPFKNR
ncbi:MAG: enoyl-CoA hydratase-related protein [Saccharofermentanales bacterium]|jgi:enoyl-CoA hydratase